MAIKEFGPPGLRAYDAQQGYSGLDKAGKRKMRAYDAAARSARRAAFANAFQQIAGYRGNEMLGTPGFLAASPDAAGQLARLRRRNLAAGTSDLAQADFGLGAELEKGRLDALMGEYDAAQKRKEQKGSGVGRFIGSLAGTGLSLAKGLAAKRLGIPMP